MKAQLQASRLLIRDLQVNFSEYSSKQRISNANKFFKKCYDAQLLTSDEVQKMLLSQDRNKAIVSSEQQNTCIYMNLLSRYLKILKSGNFFEYLQLLHPLIAHSQKLVGLLFLDMSQNYFQYEKLTYLNDIFLQDSFKLQSLFLDQLLLQIKKQKDDQFSWTLIKFISMTPQYQNVSAANKSDISECKKKYQKLCSFIANKIDISSKNRILFLHNCPHNLFKKIQRAQFLADMFINAFKNIKENLNLAIYSLQGLFVLITEYGIQFSGFYQKLYQFTQLNNLKKLMKSEERTKFLYLMRSSLSSNQLPQTLIAAFVKRLMRFCINCSNTAQTVICIKISIEFLIKHKQCHFLMSQPYKQFNQGIKSSHSYKKDSFKFQEADPLSSNAMDSCLWQIQALKKHFHPAVRAAVDLFNQVSNQQSQHQIVESIDDFMSLSNDHILQKDLKLVRRKLLKDK